MDEIEASLKRIKGLLLKEDVVQEYFRLKKIVDHDAHLKALDEEIHQHQKLMCLNKENDELYAREKKLYEEKLSEFQNNPVVSNYFQVKEEVRDLLMEMKEILQ